MNCCFVSSPIGPLHIYANQDDTALCRIAFSAIPQAGSTLCDTPLLQQAARQLNEYFSGKRKAFDLPLSPRGTPFQKACWQALTTIPYGRTRSYGDIAKQIGTPKGSRAVGMANNQNPLPIVIPCHRVVGSDGRLIGYAGGLENKQMLLSLEGENSHWIQFGKKETDYLCKADPALARVIKAIPPPDYEMIPDLFAALVRNILGQQISGKALATVWQRAQTQWGAITPQNLSRLTTAELCAVGISGRKADYVRAAAESVLAGSPDLTALKEAGDEQAIEQLCSLKGVGRWTAEMLLMFSLGRRDILSYGDFGIRQGLCRIHNLTDGQLSKEKFEEYRRLYSPCGTVASLYLWAAGNSPVWPPRFLLPTNNSAE